MAGKTEYKNKFQAEKYDRIIVNVTKGKKESIAEHAKRKDMSLNGYINSLIEKDMAEDN